MSKGTIVLCVVLGLLALAVIGWIGAYGGLNSGNQASLKSWGDVEAQLQRRYDLVPNLVKTVQAYANHEEKVLTAVTEARAKVGQINVNAANANPAVLKQFMAAQGELSSALSRLMVVVEKYPDLKANEGFLKLQDQLEGTENRISVTRQRYNEAVQPYNTSVNGLFAGIVARVHGFQERPYFKASEESQKAPVVNFN